MKKGGREGPRVDGKRLLCCFEKRALCLRSVESGGEAPKQGGKVQQDRQSAIAVPRTPTWCLEGVWQPDSGYNNSVCPVSHGPCDTGRVPPLCLLHTRMLFGAYRIIPV